MFRKLSVVALVVFLFASSASADCIWIYHVDQDPELVCTYAQYYTTLGSEPDWCDYAYGDLVFIRRQAVGGVLAVTGRYVIPAGDGASHPPSDFGQYPEDAVGTDCNLFQLPW